MANVVGAYCAESDLRTGDLAPPSYTTKVQYIQNAAEEIDAAIGHLYITPVTIDSAVSKNRPSILFLKKLNWLLASGRFILDVAAAGEMDNLNAYGKRMLDEANMMIASLISSDLQLVGAPLIAVDPNRAKNFTGPVIYNEDPYSLVETFYRQRRLGSFYGESYPVRSSPVMPYGK